MSRTISNTDDIIDSRDVIARIAELEGERDSFPETWAGDHDAHYEVPAWADDNPDDAEELRVLLELASEGEDSPGWTHGETLIRDSYFEDYARELAEDIGSVPHDAPWPCSYIDWERAADALKQDYISADFDGVEYWIRA